MNAAKKLKKYIETITKRGDLNIISMEIGEPVDKETLKLYKGEIPDDLLHFYSIMNGCYLLSNFVNDSNLEVGINIPPIESIGGFETPDDRYNFEKGIKIVPFEWIEGQYSPFYYCMPDSEKDVNKAQIITAVSGREGEYTIVADNLENWIALAIENCLAFGWGNPEEFGSEIKETRSLFSHPPEKRRVFLPDSRVTTTQDDFLRGKVIRQFMAKEQDIYGRQDFTLVEFDIDETYWMDSADLKPVTNKKDYYESLLKDPGETLRALSKMKAEESVIALARISMSENQYLGIAVDGDALLPSVPCGSIRFVQLFKKLSLEESADIIIAICNNWMDHIKDNFNQMLDLPVDGSEYNKKDTHIIDREYSYKYMLENILGTLVYLIAWARNTKAEHFSFSDENKNKLRQVFDRVNKLNEQYDPLNKFHPGVERFDNLFQSKILRVREMHEIAAWQEDMGIGDYPHVVCI